MTDSDRTELDSLKIRVLTLEHQHAALLATIEKLIRRLGAVEAKAETAAS